MIHGIIASIKPIIDVKKETVDHDILVSNENTFTYNPKAIVVAERLPIIYTENESIETQQSYSQKSKIANKRKQNVQKSEKNQTEESIKSFTEPQEKKKHLNKNKEICEVCGFKTATLKSHMLTHTKEVVCVCDVCGKTFSVKTLLKFHLFSHFNIR